MSARLRADKHAIEVRRAEAQERNAKWAALSSSEKILSLRNRRGASKRQIDKLVGAAK